MKNLEEVKIKLPKNWDKGPIVTTEKLEEKVIEMPIPDLRMTRISLYSHYGCWESEGKVSLADFEPGELIWANKELTKDYERQPTIKEMILFLVQIHRSVLYRIDRELEKRGESVRREGVGVIIK